MRRGKGMENSKSEVRNPKQIRMTKFEIGAVQWTRSALPLSPRNCFLFSATVQKRIEAVDFTFPARALRSESALKIRCQCAQCTKSSQFLICGAKIKSCKKKVRLFFEAKAAVPGAAWFVAVQGGGSSRHCLDDQREQGHRIRDGAERILRFP